MGTAQPFVGTATQLAAAFPPLRRILPDLMGRTLQVVDAQSGELVCFVYKSTKVRTQDWFPLLQNNKKYIHISSSSASF